MGDGKNAASLKQIRAALSFAYKHWDLMNPFAKIEPPLQNEPQIRYLLLSNIRRLLDYLKARQQGYGSALAFHPVQGNAGRVCFRKHPARKNLKAGRGKAEHRSRGAACHAGRSVAAPD